MADTFTWLDRGSERRLWLDDPAAPGARYLAVRRLSSDDDWSAACVLEPGGAEREIGDGLVVGMAEDAILKFAIQGLASLHGISPAPGLPDTEAGEAEVVILKLWQLLTARWAPPGA
jgi:acetylornithine deacetylase/succinyl-diaminopimelate desuccinylase-like protein